MARCDSDAPLSVKMTPMPPKVGGTEEDGKKGDAARSENSFLSFCAVFETMEALSIRNGIILGMNLMVNHVVPQDYR